MNLCLKKNGCSSLDDHIEQPDACQRGCYSSKQKVDDSIPLPEPCPLPKHFKSDVEADLKSGKMSFNSHRVFMSNIASSMLAFKKSIGEDRTLLQMDIMVSLTYLINTLHSRIMNRYMVPFSCYLSLPHK